MNSVVADTHVLIWYLDAPEELSAAATQALDAAIEDANSFVYVSSISLAEMLYLMEKNRIKAKVFRQVWQEIKLAEPILIEVPVDNLIVAAMKNIPRAEVPDLPDRIISATALHLNLPLVTRDGKIRASGVATIW